ncbi:hypothetical protein LINGRAHAP2_LOCUS12084 [Linum grandiflorum]
MAAVTVRTCFLTMMQTSGSSVPKRHTVRPSPKPARVMIRSSPCFSITSQIFENPVEGIVCYRDARTGEVICEGYDEGPRFEHHRQYQQQIPLSSAYKHHSTRDGEIMMNLLQQRLLQIVNGTIDDDNDQFEGTTAAAAVMAPLQEDLSQFKS